VPLDHLQRQLRELGLQRIQQLLGARRLQAALCRRSSFVCLLQPAKGEGGKVLVRLTDTAKTASTQQVSGSGHIDAAAGGRAKAVRY
jgi:hypothetical protein